MSSSSLFILYVLSIYGYTCSGCRVDIEAEHGDSANGVQMYRSKASNGITVLIKQGENITFEFKVIPSTCQLTVDYVQYSNDGISDILVLYWNTTIIGQFRSKAVSLLGHSWNIMRSSGQVGNPIQIFKGSSELQIEAKFTDQYGVELDKLSLQFNCSNTSSVSDICPISVVDTTGLIDTTVSIDNSGDDKKTRDIIAIVSTVGLFSLGLIGTVITIISVSYKFYRKRQKRLASMHLPSKNH